jgi:hypothetical protein
MWYMPARIVLVYGQMNLHECEKYSSHTCTEILKADEEPSVLLCMLDLAAVGRVPHLRIGQGEHFKISGCFCNTVTLGIIANMVDQACIDKRKRLTKRSHRIICRRGEIERRRSC